MRRRLPHMLAAISVAMLAATMVLWVRVNVTNQRTLYVFHKPGGIDWLVKAEGYEISIARIHQISPTMLPNTSAASLTTPSWWNFGGFTYVSSPPAVYGRGRPPSEMLVRLPV